VSVAVCLCLELLEDFVAVVAQNHSCSLVQSLCLLLEKETKGHLYIFLSLDGFIVA
jgi:hypothetical protein